MRINVLRPPDTDRSRGAAIEANLGSGYVCAVDNCDAVLVAPIPLREHAQCPHWFLNRLDD